MLKLSHRILIFLSGFLWLNVGIYLLSMGTLLVLRSALSSHTPSPLSLFSLLPKESSPQQKALILLFSTIFLGYLKYFFVLRKTIEKQVYRIRSFPNPAPWKNLFSLRYFLLILTMILLGATLRHLSIAAETRGAINLIIGAALISGALQYFRQALMLYVQGSQIR